MLGDASCIFGSIMLRNIISDNAWIIRNMYSFMEKEEGFYLGLFR